MSTTKKSREMVPERIYDILLNAKTADKATMHLKDGRIVQGALTFNHYKGTGRLIDIEREVSIDFAVSDIRELKLAPAPAPAPDQDEVVEAAAARCGPAAPTGGAAAAALGRRGALASGAAGPRRRP